MVLWADELAVKELARSEPVMGLATYLAKLEHFRLAQFLRENLDWVHIFNTNYRARFTYRKYGREIGLAWFQELLDELHRRSQTNGDLPPLRDYLEKFEGEVHSAVMDSLKTRFPKKAQDKGSITMTQVENRLKGLENRQLSSKQLDQKIAGKLAKGNGKGDRERGNRRNSRSRSRDRRREKTPPRNDRGNRGSQGSSKKSAESSSREANQAFQLGKDKGKCPHLQKDECSYGSKCNKTHECVLCGKEGHGALRCKLWGTPQAKKLLG